MVRALSVSDGFSVPVADAPGSDETTGVLDPSLTLQALTK